MNARVGHEQTLKQRGLLLEYATLAWNVAGVVVLVLAAYAARSVALAGFGLDSLIEIFASLVVVWQLTSAHRDRARAALRLIGIAFMLLVVYLAAQLAYTILTRTRPAPSVSGIVWTGATVVAMLLLAYGKHATGRQLGNVVLRTEARVTLIDAYLAGAVLVGVGVNAVLGWWWADPLASLVIVYYAVREAKAALVHSASL